MSLDFHGRVEAVFPRDTYNRTAYLAICLLMTCREEDLALRWLYRYEVEHNRVLPPIDDVISLVERSSEKDLWQVITKDHLFWCPKEFRQ